MNELIKKYPSSFKKDETDIGKVFWLILRESYIQKSTNPKLFLSFLDDHNEIEKLMDFHITQAASGDIISAVWGFAKITSKIKNFKDSLSSYPK